MKLVYDTYALVEILAGNPRYKQYADLKNAVLTNYVLTELYYRVLRDKGKQEADKVYDNLVCNCVDIPHGVVKQAMQLRLEFSRMHKDRKLLSYADAIGYALSLNLDIKFLTGDKSFEGFENVEYVK